MGGVRREPVVVDQRGRHVDLLYARRTPSTEEWCEEDGEILVLLAGGADRRTDSGCLAPLLGMTVRRCLRERVYALSDSMLRVTC